MAASLSFDRAAGFYDETRKISDDAIDRVTQAILDRAPSGPPILECGVGTGRIAIPLLKYGAPLIGVDLSREMMSHLRSKFEPAALAQADVSRLPFPDRAFGAVLTVHVLHVVGPWRETLREIRRVLQPGGVYFNSHNYRPSDSPNQRLRQRWRDSIEARGYAWRRPGAQSGEEVVEELRRMGAQVEMIEVTRWTSSHTAREEIESIADRTSSDTWNVPDDVMAESVADLRAWAAAEYGDLDAPISVERRFVFDIARF